MRYWTRASDIRQKGEQGEARYPQKEISEAIRILASLQKEPIRVGRLAITAVFLIMAAFAGVISPFGPLDTSAGNPFEKPGPNHYFGTDDLGRDVFSGKANVPGLV